MVCTTCRYMSHTRLHTVNIYATYGKQELQKVVAYMLTKVAYMLRKAAHICCHKSKISYIEPSRVIVLIYSHTVRPFV